MKKILENTIYDVISTINERVDEYASNITGYEETMYMDVLYEEYVSTLEGIRERLEIMLEIINSVDESLQEKNKK